MRIIYALSICILAIYVFVIIYSIYHRPRPEICICDTLSIRPTIYESSPALNDYMLWHHNPYLTDVYMEILEIDCMIARGKIVNNSEYAIIFWAYSFIDHYCEREQRWNEVPPRDGFVVVMNIMTKVPPGEYRFFLRRIREVNDTQYSGLFRIVKTIYRDVNPYDDASPRVIDSERHSIAAMFSW